MTTAAVKWKKKSDDYIIMIKKKDERNFRSREREEEKLFTRKVINTAEKSGTKRRHRCVIKSYGLNLRWKMC